MLSASLALTRYLLQHSVRRFLPLAVCLAALAAPIAGCGGGDEGGDARPEGPRGGETAAIPDELAGAPPPLAALHRQANRLLDGGPDAFEARLAKLEGYPVVVNKWGSWCTPCREELPWFQSQALERGKEIAFLGVDAVDPEDEARALLEEVPLSFPSYKDPDSKVSAVFNGVVATPVTAFYDSGGELAYLKQGAYENEQALVEDIERYAR